MKYRCPSCGFESTKNKVIGSYIQCSACHSLFVTSFPSSKTFTERNNAWATHLCEGVIHPVSKDIKKRIEYIKKNTKETSLLDVGCGDGRFLMAAKENDQPAGRQGFIVSGMDIAKPFQKFVSEQGIPMYSSLKDIPNRSYDTVTCFDVIEHTVDTNSFIKELYRIGKPKSLLLLTTPNAQSISSRMLGKKWWVLGPEDHYVLFSVASLQKFLVNNGYKILDTKTDIFTKWFQPTTSKRNILFNKCVYLLIVVFLPFLYRLGLGDNIQILARKR
jgi:2-polyprenyl-3-methyl-5-hydroxy-6-metoxy-1,4-benzoquinol methylase